MGIIKMAVLGGAGMWAVKQIRNEREKDRSHQQQMSQSNGYTRSIPDEKSFDMSGSAANPPAYSNQYPAGYYQQQQQQQQQQHPVEQMIFTDPSQNQYQDQRAIDNVPHNAQRQQSGSIVGSNDKSTNNELIEQAMTLLGSGQQEKARQILASIAGKK